MGGAYIIQRLGTGVWSEEAVLAPGELKAEDGFGSSVAIHGTIAAVGSPGDDGENCTSDCNMGAVYVYRKDGGEWVQDIKLTPPGTENNVFFGTSVSIHSDRILIGAPGKGDGGSAYVYALEGLNWTLEAILEARDTGSGDDFGQSVSLLGELALIGSPDNENSDLGRSGSAYLYEFDGSRWLPVQELMASDGANGDDFGASVALSSGYLIIGSPFDDNEFGVNAGSAYLFENSTGDWVESNKLMADESDLSDAFGSSVSISESYAVVGSSDTPATPHLYQFTEFGWADVLNISIDGGDGVGHSVFVNDEYVVIGDYENNDVGSDAGAVYALELAALNLSLPIPDAPLLVAPEPNELGVWIDKTFVWRPAVNAQTYQFQLSMTEDFSSEFVLEGVFADTTVFASGLTAGAMYFWRVRGLNVDLPGEWSDTFSFQTASEGPVELSGNIRSNLQAQFSPYILVGDVQVLEGAVMEIEPGVTIEASGSFSFDVYGSLIAEGTETDPIFFTTTSDRKSHGNWGGIDLYLLEEEESGFPDASAIFDYTTVEYAETGILARSTNVSISNSTLSKNSEHGIRWYGFTESASGVITTSTLSQNFGWGVYVEAVARTSNGSASPTITDNLITGNFGGGIYLRADGRDGCSSDAFDRTSSATASPTILGNRIVDNSGPALEGMATGRSTPTDITRGCFFTFISRGTVRPQVDRNIIANNIDAVLARAPLTNGVIYGFTDFDLNHNTLYNNGGDVFVITENAELTFSNTIVWGRDEGNFVTESGGSILARYSIIEHGFESADDSTNLMSDPLFVDVTNGNFSLQAGSPAINAGDPSGENDPDGSRADIGALPFLQQSAPILASVPDQQVVAGEQFEYQVTASANPEPTYSLSSSPDGMRIGPGSGLITWTPLIGGEYAAVVRAVNSVGEDSVSFNVVVLEAPAIPDLVSPENNSIRVALDATLTWASISDVDSFHVQLATTESFESALDDVDPVQGNSFLPSALDSMQTYYWRVRSRRGNLYSAWTPTSTFTTVGINILPPEVEEGGTASEDGTILLTWGSVSNADSYTIFRDTSPNPVDSIAAVTHPDTSYSDSGLVNDGRSYYYRIKAIDSEGEESAFSENIEVETLDLIPAGTVQQITALSTGASIIVRWQPVLEAGSYQVFRGVNEQDLSFLASVEVSGQGDVFYEDEPDDIGDIAYYYAVKTVDENNVVGELSSVVVARTFDYPTMIPLNNRVTFGSPTELTSWLLVSLPGSNSRSIAETLQGEPGKNGDWRVFRDTGTEAQTEGLIEYRVGDDATFLLRPGVGYWLLSKNPWVINQNAVASVEANVGVAEIPIHSGWNIIANPFERGISVDLFLEQNGLNESTMLWGYSRGFVEATTLEPYEGYYFFNENDTLSTLSFFYGDIPVDNLPNAKTPLFQRLRISATNGELPASAVELGFANEALTTHDSFDSPAPPGYFIENRLSLINTKIDRYADLYRDVRALDEVNQEFDVQLDIGEPGPVQLRFEGIEQHEGREVYFVDMDLVKFYDLRKTDMVWLNPDKARTTYKVITGTADFVASKKKEFVPASLRLLQNYPNPFSNQTTFEYALPSEEAVRVRLEVFNAIGQRVALLVDAVQEGGFHQYRWSGLTDSGAPLSSGVYFYRLKVDDQIETKSLIRF